MLPVQGPQATSPELLVWQRVIIIIIIIIISRSHYLGSRWLEAPTFCPSCCVGEGISFGLMIKLLLQPLQASFEAQREQVNAALAALQEGQTAFKNELEIFKNCQSELILKK